MSIFKTQQQVITEIHNEFDTAQDRLLRQANELLLNHKPDNVTPIESIGERLQKVGFVNVPVAKKASMIKEVKKKDVQIAVATKEQADLIQYYKSAYPFLKFLTENELNRICDKYSLIHAPVGNYIQEVPEKNLRDIETSQVLKSNDKPDEVELFSGRVWCDYHYEELRRILDLKCSKVNSIRFDRIKQIGDEYISDETRIAIGVLNTLGIPTGGIRKSIWIDGTVSNVKMDGLFIAAPSTHFDLQGLTKKSKHGFFEVFKTEIKDPIVFRYVRGGIQVITKWGLEANDPSLVVPVLN